MGQPSRIREQIRLINETNHKLILSDHAIVRYLERSGIVDIAAIREYLLDESKGYFKKYGSGRFPLEMNLTVVIDEGVIKTVIRRK